MTRADQFVRCVGCGALVRDQPGPTHRYMESSPGCWAVYGEVLAREYSDISYAGAHRLTVDAYAVQHPGTSSSQSIQSVGVHLLRLCLILERGYSDKAAAHAMPLLSQQKRSFHWLTPPQSLGEKTVLDLWNARDAAAHTKAAKEWALSAWHAWSPHHAQVRDWLPQGV